MQGDEGGAKGADWAGRGGGGVHAQYRERVGQWGRPLEYFFYSPLLRLHAARPRNVQKAISWCG